MAAYLFQMELPAFTDELLSLIPEHRSYINKLFSEGRIISYSVSEQRNIVWCVVDADDEQGAMQIITGLPLHPYFTDIIWYPLLFHNVLPAAWPEFSLN